MGSQNNHYKHAGTSHTAEGWTIVDNSSRPLSHGLGVGYPWSRFRLPVKGDALGMLTYFSELQGELMRLLKVLGLVNPGRVKAKAFHRLQARLFRSTGVQAVSVRGFAKSTRTIPIEYGDDVSVILSKDPNIDLQREIERIFSEINRRHDTKMTPVFIWRKALDSTSHE